MQKNKQNWMIKYFLIRDLCTYLWSYIGIMYAINKRRIFCRSIANKIVINLWKSFFLSLCVRYLRINQHSCKRIIKKWMIQNFSIRDQRTYLCSYIFIMYAINKRRIYDNIPIEPYSTYVVILSWLGVKNWWRP